MNIIKSFVLSSHKGHLLLYLYIERCHSVVSGCYLLDLWCHSCIMPFKTHHKYRNSNSKYIKKVILIQFTFQKLNCSRANLIFTAPPQKRCRYPPSGSRHPPGTDTPPVQCMLADTGNKRAVRILLECILVIVFFLSFRSNSLFSQFARERITTCIYYTLGFNLVNTYLSNCSLVYLGHRLHASGPSASICFIFNALFLKRLPKKYVDAPPAGVPRPRNPGYTLEHYSFYICL